jgi:hypothetical protein
MRDSREGEEAGIIQLEVGKRPTIKKPNGSNGSSTVSGIQGSKAAPKPAGWTVRSAEKGQPLNPQIVELT